MNILDLNVTAIDRRVLAGKELGLIKPEERDQLPSSIGDWSLRVVNIAGQTTAMLVAVPTNSRTRNLYTEGRMVWLRDLGFDEGQAQDYSRASQSVMYRWEEQVARFVLANERMSTEHWNDIFRHNKPRDRANELGYTHSMSRNRLTAAMQILMNIWEL